MEDDESGYQEEGSSPSEIDQLGLGRITLAQYEGLRTLRDEGTPLFESMVPYVKNKFAKLEPSRLRSVIHEHVGYDIHGVPAPGVGPDKIEDTQAKQIMVIAEAVEAGGATSELIDSQIVLDTAKLFVDKAQQEVDRRTPVTTGALKSLRNIGKGGDELRYKEEDLKETKALYEYIKRKLVPDTSTR